MTKRNAILSTILAALMFLAASAWASETVVRGTCKGEDGKPVANGSVEILNLENGQKVTAKTNDLGQYSAVALRPGNYKLSLFDSAGKLVFYIENIAVNNGKENVYDIDVAKEMEQAGTVEERAARQQALKSNEKIKQLNLMMQQAAALKKEAKFAEAVTVMEQAIALDQTHDVVFAVLADAYLSARKFPEAEANYRKALQLAPPTSKELGNYHAQLALALFRQGKADEGMAECDTQGHVDPKAYSLCYYNGGAILTNAGKLDQANTAFDKAIAADPTKPEPYYQKGVNLMGKAGLKDGKMIPVPGTAEAFNKYLELAPDGPNAQPAKDMLAAIGAKVETSFGSDSRKKGKK